MGELLERNGSPLLFGLGSWGTHPRARFSLTLVLVVVAGACLAAYFSVSGFRPVPLMSDRRWDKLWQLLLLGPVIASVATLVAQWVRRDLSGLWQGFCARVHPGIVVGVGGVALLWVAAGPLQRLPGSRDEVEYLFQGRMLARGALWAPAPPCPEAFALRGMTIHQGRWVVAYDPGHSLLLGVADRVRLSWLVGPGWGMLALVMVFLIGRDVWGPRIGMGALCLGVLSPFFVVLCACHSYHSTSLGLTSLLWLCRIRRGKGPVWDVGAGLALGGLTLTRPLALTFLALPLVLAEVTEWRQTRRIPWGSWAKGALAFLPLLAAYLAYNAAVTGHPLVTGRQLVHPGGLFGFGPHATPAETYGSKGHTPLKGLINVTLQVATLSTGLFGWPLLSLVPAAWGFWAWRSSPWVRSFVLVPACTAFVLFFSWYAAIEHGPRHYLDAWPGLILLSSLGIDAIAGAARRRGGVAGTNAVAAALIGLFVLGATTYVPVRLSDLTTRRLGVDPRVGRVASAAVPAPAVVFVDTPSAPADYFCSGFVHNDPWLRSPLVYARHRTDELDLACLSSFPGREGWVLSYDPQTKAIGLRALAAAPTPGLSPPP